MYLPETCKDISEWCYLHCVKALSNKSLIQIFDDVIANHELVESVRETEKKNATMSHIVAHVWFFFCYLSSTVAHLLLDDIKQAAAQLLIPFCVFKIPKVVDFSIQEKSGEVWKRNKQLSWKFLPRGADYAFYSFLFGKIQVSLTIRNLVCSHYYGPIRFWWIGCPTIWQVFV